MNNLQKINNFIKDKQKYLSDLSACINYLNVETNNSFNTLKEFLPLDVVEKRNYIVTRYNKIVENLQKIITLSQTQNTDEVELTIGFDYRKNIIDKTTSEISHTTQQLYNQHIRNLKRASKQGDIIKDVKHYQALIPQSWLSSLKINTTLSTDATLERKLTKLFYFPMYKFDLGGKTRSNFGSFMVCNSNVLIEKELREDFVESLYPFKLSINLIFDSESIFIFNKDGRFDNADGTFKNEKDGTIQLNGDDMFKKLNTYFKRSKGEGGFLIKEVIEKNKEEIKHPIVKETTPLDIIINRVNKLTSDQTSSYQEKQKEQNINTSETISNPETIIETSNTLENPETMIEEEFNDEELYNGYEEEFISFGTTLNENVGLSPSETIEKLKAEAKQKEVEQKQAEKEKLKKQKEVRELLFKQSTTPIKVTTKKKNLKTIQTHKVEQTPTITEPTPQKTTQMSAKNSLVGVGLHSKKK